MSTIVIAARVESPSAALIGRIREITGKPIGDLRHALVMGTPLVIELLFCNDHDERRDALHDLRQR